MVSLPNALITFEAGSVSISFVLPDLDPIVTTLASLSAKIDSLTTKEDQIVSNQTANQGVVMAALDDLEAKVTSVQGVQNSAMELLKVLHDELVAAAGDPARIQAVVDKLAQSSDALAAAVAANPDPAAAPPPAPPAGP